MNQKIRLGMIGGGEGAFIGAVHRIAANMDGQYHLVCGAFSGSPEKSQRSGLALGIGTARAYASYEEMFEKENQLPVNERMQVVSIVTPNHLHFAPAKMAMEMGFDVILDKPMTFNFDEAKALKNVVEETGRLFCLTHTYTGYPMIKEAKQLIAAGRFGAIKKIYVEYPQGWLSTFLEKDDNKQASWRTDPKRSGIAGCMGDIGTHAFNLAEYVSGLQVTKICADLNIVVAGRLLDDDGTVLLKFNNGATGVLIATQVAAGEENNVKIRVYGEKGGLEWNQDVANTLLLKWLNEPTQIYRTGGGYTNSFSSHNTRTPSGHPEGYLEAFANIYRNFALTLSAKIENKIPKNEWLDFPGIEEGIRGMAFVENVVASSKSDVKWMAFLV